MMILHTPPLFWVGECVSADELDQVQRGVTEWRIPITVEAIRAMDGPSKNQGGWQLFDATLQRRISVKHQAIRLTATLLGRLHHYMGTSHGPHGGWQRRWRPLYRDVRPWVAYALSLASVDGCWVYLRQDPSTGMFKVGRTTNPASRFKPGTDNPVVLKTIALKFDPEGSATVSPLERQILADAKPFRERGEWFRPQSEGVMSHWFTL